MFVFESSIGDIKPHNLLVLPALNNNSVWHLKGFTECYQKFGL